MRELNELTGMIIASAIDIHRALGPGLLESVYQRVLVAALRQKGLDVQSQIPVQFVYGDIQFDDGLRLDLLVEGRVIVELKSIEQVSAIHKKQVLTYLHLTNAPVALLINFGQARLKDGIYRLINNRDYWRDC
ncbi:MAG: GxxExxY protein [Chloroflexia bacterium]|nr:GxxExxY protein [Chloroflexia bacterium]